MKMSDDYSGYSYAQLREKLISAELPALREAGLLDPDTIRYLESYRRNYDPNSELHYDDPDETAYWYYNTERYTEIVRRNIGENLSKAVKNEEWGIIKHATGLSGDSGRSPDVVQYEKFRELFTETGLVLITSGSTKSGKTSSNGRFLQFGRTIHGDQFRASTHVKSLAENYDWIDFVQTDEELKRWCKYWQGYKKYFLGDEAHEWGTGYGHHRDGIEKKMSSFVRLAGKEPYRVNMLLICHRADGMHPALQNDELCYYARKEGDTQEEARRNIVFYDTLRNGDLQDEKFSMTIKHTDLTYSPHDTTPFIIETDEDEVDKVAYDDGTPALPPAPQENAPRIESEDDREKQIDRSKVEAVVDYLQSDDGLRTVADDHDIGHSTLNNWVKKFSED